MFPSLKTGAVMQYPAKRTLQFNTDAIRFLDGTEQRFRDNPSVLHQWTIQLDLLDESELSRVGPVFRIEPGQIRQLFLHRSVGRNDYPNCSLGADTFGFQLRGEMRGKTDADCLREQDLR
jgi:hypothetical protein